MTVHPRWNPFYRPLFWLFRRVFADHVGQFNLPIDDAEANKGLESHIDTIDIDHDKMPDVRGWVRTYLHTDTTVYVGIYTVANLADGAYVSVGFPLPEANLTATLVPMNKRKHDFLLTSKKLGSRFAGDYIAFIDDEETPKRISAFRMRGFREEIEVYVRNDKLFTDHRFYFLGCNFLTLFYRLERKAGTNGVGTNGVGTNGTRTRDVKVLMKKAPGPQRKTPSLLLQQQ